MSGESSIVQAGCQIARRTMPCRGGSESRAIEAWLQQDLASRHNAALSEELPAEWLDLIGRFG
jgi:hypothetical protein